MNTLRDSPQGPPEPPSPVPVRRRPIAIRWNAGGWAGCVFGCTLWMFVGAVPVVAVNPPVSAALFALFLLAVGLGAQLYRRRASLAVSRAVQVYMLSLLAISLVYLALADRTGVLERVSRTWSYPVEVPSWAIPACYLGILLLVTYLRGLPGGQTDSKRP